MTFGRWYPLGDWAAQPLSGPGLFQVRVVDGLRRYPRGQSAMIHYGGGRDLAAIIAAFAAAHPDVDWLCRHTIVLAAADEAAPEVSCERLVERFRVRFGTPPTLPSEGT